MFAILFVFIRVIKMLKLMVLSANGDSGKSVLFITLIFVTILPIYGEYIVECHGLPPPRTGLTMECVSPKYGGTKFNCSSPMPVDTMVFYSCLPYFKEPPAKTLFETKSMRCNKEGRWTRYNYFSEFKCEYECGRAMPATKNIILNGQLVSRTSWSWHALIYVKVNWAKVVEAIEYKEAYLENQKTAKKRQGIGTDSISYEDEEFVLDPEKLAEIFENDELSREDIFDPRYRYLYICGGTLISQSHVLTAAHCLTDPKGNPRAPKDFMVVLGATTNNFYDHITEPKSQIIPVHQMYISLDFDYDNYKADIGIIELLQPAILSSAVLPACLPDNKEDAMLFIANRKHGEAIGSRINIYREGISDELKSKKLQVLANIECVKNIERIPSDKEFCAGNTGADICSGDSGGGLVAAPNFGLRRRYIVQGIISYANARKVCENYAVFTRVYPFLDWIKGIVFSNGSSVNYW